MISRVLMVVLLTLTACANPPTPEDFGGTDVRNYDSFRELEDTALEDTAVPTEIEEPIETDIPAETFIPEETNVLVETGLQEETGLDILPEDTGSLWDSWWNWDSGCACDSGLIIWGDTAPPEDTSVPKDTAEIIDTYVYDTGWENDSAWMIDTAWEDTSSDLGPKMGEDCGIGAIYDCDLSCEPSNYVGDHWCDNDPWAADFDCLHFNWDEGDCN